METLARRRWVMAATGLSAGLSFWAIGQVLKAEVLAPRAALALSVLALVFFLALLALAGTFRLARAAGLAALLALAVSGLLSLTALRFAVVDEVFSQPLHVLAAMVVTFVPLPFVLASAGGDWRHYPALFTESWGLFVRLAVAMVFAGILWLVLFLSDALLSIVGITLVGDLLASDIVASGVTGLIFGLVLAVVAEMSDYVSPALVVRLLRLLLPLVLGVMVVFIAALPVRGLSGLFEGWSAALILLAMTGGAATLVTAAADRDEDEAVPGPVMRRSAQALALLMPVPAALGAYAVALRVLQYGWTPERLFAALVAALALGYGLIYAAALVHRGGWMDRIRRGNVAMALALVVVSALWLSPVLNAERISARSQVDRYAAAGGEVDAYALSGWGLAGLAAQDEILALATARGDEVAEAVLKGGPQAESTAPSEDLRQELLAILPLQPATATAQRDALLAAADSYLLESWLADCRGALPVGDGPACVMVVADLWPESPGEEAALLHIMAGSPFLVADLLSLTETGGLRIEPLRSVSGALPEDEAAARLIAEWQAAPPPLAPARVNQIGAGAGGFVALP